MIGRDPMFLCAETILRTEAPRRRPAWRMRGRIVLLIVAAALASRAVSLASAQGNPPTPTSPTVPCLAEDKKALVMPPEINASDGMGIISLAEEAQRLPPIAAGNANCPQQLMRVYRPGLPQQPSQDLLNPLPGPTLRARIGDIVQLTLVNMVDANRFDSNVVIGPNGCMQVGKNGGVYPGSFDIIPNCLHASSTVNIHYHGTHTNPDATGDNVFLQILPLPRDNAGNLTTKPTDAMIGLERFFKDCTAQLKYHPLNQWPRRWKDMPQDWILKQTTLLQDYQKNNPDQKIWDADEMVIEKGWPQYYIGVVPYCFVLPHKPEDEPVDKGDLRMGQAPGTHWYHAHKHGSTAIDVMNGMTGAFIIEGQYDDDLNAFYASYDVKRSGESLRWNTRSQPVLVLNQLGTTPNQLSATHTSNTPAGVAFAVNGLVGPKAHMQPGEVQLWRMVNSSSRSAAYFMAPEGLHWRQLAQDGVQFARPTYASSHNQNRPFYMAPANRVDLLVQAPMTPGTFSVKIQAVMARSQVQPTPAKPNANDPVPGTALMTVDVSGDPVTQNGQPVLAPMPFPTLGTAPDQPKFLADITDAEWAGSNYAARTFTFDSKNPFPPPNFARAPEQHTINGLQFDDSRGKANVQVTLGYVEEWTIKNATIAPSSNAQPPTGPGAIDHPFHIHINPYQITEVFDPNENLVNPETGALLTQLQVTDKNGQTTILTQDECDKLSDGTHCKTIPVPRYVTDKAKLSDPQNPFRIRQCFLDPANENTWSVAGACGPQPPQSNLIWWDTFAIPSGRVEQQKVIPGYFKMRSRFVDYQGTYVMHCHILIHEDRGMMFTVNVIPAPELMVHHH